MDANYELFQLKRLRNKFEVANFEITSIKELCKISSGGTPSRTNPDYFEGDIPWIKTAEVRDEIIDATEEFITEIGLTNSSAKIYPAGSLIIAMYGQGATRGKTAKLGIDAATNQACAVLTDFKTSIIPDFMWYYLMGQYDNLRSYAGGNTQPNLTAALISGYPIPLPPLDIQQRLVDAMESARAARKGKLAEADSLLAGMDSYVLDALGLTLPPQEERLAFAVTLGDIFTHKRFDAHFHQSKFYNLVELIQNQSNSPLGNVVKFSSEVWNPADETSETFNYIEISGINTQTGQISPTVTAVIEAPSRARMLVRTDDIILSLTRPQRGAVAYIESQHNEHITSTGFAVIRDIKDKSVHRQYIFSVLRSQLCLQQMLQRSSGGNYPAITEEELANILIPIPTWEIQMRIVEEAARRREEARRLRSEAEALWAAARGSFENALLGVEG